MKKILMLLFFVVTVFSFSSVKAALPSTFTLKEGSSRVNSPSNPIVNGWSTSEAASFSYKYTTVSGTDYLVFCTDDRSAAASVESNAYSITTDWSDAVKAGIGEIIVQGVGENATTSKYSSTSSDLFTTQMAIWKYLENKGLYSGASLDYTMESMEKNYSSYYTRVNNLLNYASTAESRINNINNFAPTLTTTTLTFTKSGDYYVSNAIKVSGNYINAIGTPTVNIGEVTGNNDSGYIVKVPISKLTSEKVTVNLSVNVSSQTQKLARNYSTGSSSYQTTTIVLLESKSNSKTLSASGTITVTPTLTIKKVDTSGNLINGAVVNITKDGAFFKKETLTNGTFSINSGLSYGKYCVTEVTAPSGYVLSNISECVTLSASNPSGTITIKNKLTEIYFTKRDGVTGKALPGATLQILDANKKPLTDAKYNWVSTSEVYGISGLPVGTYYLKEVTAPTGYILNTNLIEFKIKSDGSVSANESNISGSTIIMENRQISISFSKIDADNAKPLAGATLQILNENKEVILDESGNPKYEWVSTTETHVIDGLPVGTYYLKEVAAPIGYSLNTDLIKFTINEDGSVVTEEQKSTETIVIIMENKKNMTIFSKQDATTGKELPGATLQILDKDKKEIKDANGNIMYKWVSSNTPHTIEGLPAGTYYLKEVIQPKGYELSEELVKFEVKSDGTVTKVVMKNVPLIEVPDTGNNSLILIIVGSIIGLAGIGLIVYAIIRKKNSNA